MGGTMRDIWARVIMATIIVASMTTLLIVGACGEAAAFGIFGLVGGFFFGQYVPSPTNGQ